MPNLGSFHPQIVHFVVALLFVAVGLRILSFARRWSWMDPAALALILGGTVASAAAVHSGLDAHGPVERIPGARELVQEHEHQGQTTRNIFIAVSGIELLALAFAHRASLARYTRYAHLASALVGVYGLYMLYETAEHGGRIVYSYGGGPGLRPGDPADVNRVLIAALYNNVQAARREGRSADAAGFVLLLAQRMPAGPDAQLQLAESQVVDSKDYASALATLRTVSAPAEDGRANARVASLKADAFLGLGQSDSAKAVLREQITKFPPNARLQAKLDSIR